MSFPIDDDSLSAYCVLVCSEASSNMAKFDGICFGYRAKDYDSTDELIEKSRSEAFGHAVKKR